MYGSRPIFRAGKIPKTPFLGLSLLPNPTETLATQATEKAGSSPALLANSTVPAMKTMVQKAGIQNDTLLDIRLH